MQTIRPINRVDLKLGKEVFIGRIELRTKPCIVPGPGTRDGKIVSKYQKKGV